MQNETDHPIEATLDLTQSENLQSSSKSLLVKKRIEPKKCEFMMHVQAGFGSFNKVINHTVEHIKKK